MKGMLKREYFPLPFYIFLLESQNLCADRAKERLLKRGVKYFVAAIETLAERKMAGR